MLSMVGSLVGPKGGSGEAERLKRTRVSGGSFLDAFDNYNLSNGGCWKSALRTQSIARKTSYFLRITTHAV